MSAFQPRPYYLCAKANSPSFSQNSPSLPQNSVRLSEFSPPKQCSRNSIPPVSYFLSVTKKQPKEKVFGPERAVDVLGPFVRTSRVKNFGQALETVEKQAFGVQTSMTRTRGRHAFRGMKKKTSEEELRADFLFPMNLLPFPPFFWRA